MVLADVDASRFFLPSPTRIGSCLATRRRKLCLIRRAQTLSSDLTIPMPISPRSSSTAFYTMMHSCFALPHEIQSKPQDIPRHRSCRWRPENGSFSLPSEIAADRTALFAAYDDFDSDSADSGPCECSLAVQDWKVESWRQTVQPEVALDSDSDHDSNPATVT
ncbi:hypothetical protein BDP27DRAFT_1446425 [Rhodocollybia butyracea]|uniref:Uncharacterized protein n=1 Tax=Rhodocollybia butyracea TaxID=206335 RepID=A0A9P5PY40_9AGAR|nr:hypothetical protein BDP27DRAFT_1446425 [Rhodocollybia butyracea]